MTAYDRQQQILKILHKQSSAKVSVLAEHLGVSQVTVRSDLDVLEEEGCISRIRGGAVLNVDYHILTPSLAARSQVNEEAKRRIARRAADMVEDGDRILLDESTTVFHMVPYLRKRNHLTIVTNGVETGLALSRDTSHTVILLGGALRRDGSSVVGPLGESNLRQLHIETAFLSCTGFSSHVGMTQTDMQDAQLKRCMVASAGRVVALVDASKFGKTDLTPFARIDQLAHVLTDSSVEANFVQELRRMGVTVSVCGENTVSSYVPLKQDNGHYRIGFANLGEDQSVFAVDVRHGLEQAARTLGNIDLVMADNRLDGEVAVKVADRLVTENIDLVIEYQIDEHMGGLVASKFHEAGIPVIAVDIPMVGATYFGVDNYRAGQMAGVALGRWIEQHWQGQVDWVLVLKHEQAGSLPAARMRGQWEGLQSVLSYLSPDQIIYSNSGTTANDFEQSVYQTLHSLSATHKVAVLSFNDNATMGARHAVRSLQREKSVAIVGQGADRQVRKEIRSAGSPVIGATAFWPERYGQKLIELALKIIQGEPVPPAVYVEHVFLDASNIERYYLEDGREP
jgi:ribose transport system substrate-binding protein